MLITQLNGQSLLGGGITAIGGYVGVKALQEQLRRIAFETGKSKLDPAQYDGTMTLSTIIALANAAPVIGDKIHPIVGQALNVIGLIKAPIKKIPYGDTVIELVLSPWIIDEIYGAILGVIRVIPGGGAVAMGIDKAVDVVKTALAAAAAPLAASLLLVKGTKSGLGYSPTVDAWIDLGYLDAGDPVGYYWNHSTGNIDGIWSSVKSVASSAGSAVTSAARAAASAAAAAAKATADAAAAVARAAAAAAKATAEAAARAAVAAAKAATDAARAAAELAARTAAATASAAASAAKSAASAAVDAANAAGGAIVDVAQGAWNFIADNAAEVYAAIKKYGCAIVNNDIVVGIVAAGAGVVATPATSAAIVLGAQVGKAACAVMAIGEALYAIYKLLAMKLPAPIPLTTSEPPPPAVVAEVKAARDVQVVMPPTPPVVPLASSRYPVGTIATFDTKTQRYLIAIPVGTRLPAQFGSGFGGSGLGEVPATHFIAATKEVVPSGVPVVPSTPFQRQTHTLPIYKKPLFWIAVGVTATAAGGGGYMLYRRRRSLTR
jgi:hypothetical protein